MVAGAPSLYHIASQLDRVLKEDKGDCVLAIRSPSRGAWPSHVERHGRRFLLRWCSSPLEMREALSEERQDGLIILTDLLEADLGSDVLARLARGRLISIESWRMMRETFQARQIDPRLRGRDWMADLRRENQPAEGYAPVPGGILDADTAWRALLSSVFGIHEPRPDIDALLEWSLDKNSRIDFASLPEAARQGIAAYLRDVCGAGGALVIDAILAGNSADVVALGLVCEVVFADGWTSTDLLASAVRLEPVVGRTQIAAPAARLWAEAAIRVVRKRGSSARQIFEQAELLAKTIQAFSFVSHSSILPAAFDARMTAAATAVGSALAGGYSSQSLQAADQAGRLVFEHLQAVQQPGRSERLRMALRLLRWLARTTKEESPRFEDLASAYVSDGGFVDWARSTLLGGDALAAVSEVYVKLATAVRGRREEQNRIFATAFKTWNGEAGVARSLTPIESVLDRVVVEAAAKAPVLLLVMDGMSFGVFRRLAEDLADDGWNELAYDGVAIHAAVSTVPTVTEVARASLLCGRLCQGASNVEKAGFAAHPGLARISRSGPAPILFHKGELSDGGALAGQVRAVLGDARHRVVGLVYNAVDDHLSGADQAWPRWSLDDLQLLRPILHEAKNAGRLVILTADHGHVLEDGTRQVAKGGGDRWRPSDAPTDGEIAFDGGRVMSPEGKHSVVVAWSEQVRFGSKKAGYHGGVTPQEVLVPLAIYAAGNVAPLWEFAPPVQPDWWQSLPTQEHAYPSLVAVTAKPEPARRRPAKQPLAGQANLFDDQPAAATPTEETPADWIAALLASDVYQAQRNLAGKNAPKDEDVKAIIAALETRGRLPRATLATQLGQPLFRMNGVLASLRRVINVDQTPILEVDDDWVQLDVKQLFQQFEIKG